MKKRNRLRSGIRCMGKENLEEKEFEICIRNYEREKSKTQLVAAEKT